MSIVVPLWMLARKFSERFLDATSTWDSTTTQTWTVPAGKRWFLIACGGSRSASSTIVLKMLDSSSAFMYQIADIATGSGTWVAPNTRSDDQQVQQTVILDAGEKVAIVYGSAQGAAAYHSISVLEIDVQ